MTKSILPLFKFSRKEFKYIESTFNKQIELGRENVPTYSGSFFIFDKDFRDKLLMKLKTRISKLTIEEFVATRESLRTINRCSDVNEKIIKRLSKYYF